MNLNSLDKFNNKSEFIYEACVETIQQALSAEKKGASRIELCANLKEGGTTPSYGLIKLSKEIISIPIFVIIRPRGGDFVYDEYEIEIMKRDISMCLSLNVDGIVFGILTKTKQLDLIKIKELIDYTKSILSKIIK